MTLKASIYFNGDDCFLAWRAPRITNCLGFAIYRELERQGAQKHAGFIHNRTGFAGDNNPPGSHKPSDTWPFQRYTWTDHWVEDGDKVTYTITPVVDSGGNLSLDMPLAVKVPQVQVKHGAAGKTFAYFNRGILMSQFVARELGDGVRDTKAIAAMKRKLKKDDSPLRVFLAGDLGKELLGLLEAARNDGTHVYAVLYELEDPVLVSALRSLKKRAHVILANGSKKKKGADGNKTAAKKLENIVDLNRRFLWWKGLGHNKFLVFAKPATQPYAVWTGSANWATTGLCTQINNGLFVENKDMAKAYLAQYKLLKESGNDFPEKLLDANDQAKTGSGAGGKWRVWFTRTTTGEDLEECSRLINEAKEAIFFLMFQPGPAGLLPVVQARLSSASPGDSSALYVQGVVSTPPKKKDGESHIELVGRGEHRAFDLRIIQPEGIKEDFATWAAEITRREFIIGQGGVIGHAIVHSKVIVLDPFSNPTVITGSHNFSVAASSKNDENLVIVRGNKELAERYCVHIMGVYQHYRWRAYLIDCRKKNIDPWQGLKRDDSWQDKVGAARRQEIAFWVR